MNVLYGETKRRLSRAGVERLDGFIREEQERKQLGVGVGACSMVVIFAGSWLLAGGKLREIVTAKLSIDSILKVLGEILP